MTGNQDTPAPSDNGSPHSGGPKVKTFTCTNCGAAVSIRHPGQSMSVVCDSCHSVIDVSDELYRIISTYKGKTDLYKPVFPLGSRGKLKGELWEFIGYMVRQDNSSSTLWDEYLLFNPYHGYRWLTEYNGHWNFVKSIKEKPELTSLHTYIGRKAFLNSKIYKIYYVGHASTLFVLGEFYWRVEVGQSVLMNDYICPPEMLSSEEDRDEMIWSVSEYIQADEVRKAFNVPVPTMPMQIGVAPNQPLLFAANWEKISKLWILFAIILTVMEIFHLVTATNEKALADVYKYSVNTSADTITTPVFTLKKERANLSMRFEAPVDNSWFYVSGELVNNKDGRTYPFEKTVEYYHGIDDGESWSEGGTSNSMLFSSIPAGDYYLNLDGESGTSGGRIDTTPHVFELMVRRDVPTYANYFWCLLFLSILPIIFWWRGRNEEVERWLDSDYSPYGSSGG